MTIKMFYLKNATGPFKVETKDAPGRMHWLTMITLDHGL